MNKKVLLVGLHYTGPTISDVEIDTLGLCRPEIDENRAAYALYEYDLIVINPESYSHFIFGKKGKHSDSNSELYDLKQENDSYDLDTVFDYKDRSKELAAAAESGARVIWLLAEEKRQSFFGWRNVWVSYLNPELQNSISGSSIYKKKSRRVLKHKPGIKLNMYFDQVAADGWRLCIDTLPGNNKILANTPEGYNLGLEVNIGESIGWLLTPPTFFRSYYSTD